MTEVSSATLQQVVTVTTTPAPAPAPTSNGEGENQEQQAIAPVPTNGEQSAEIAAAPANGSASNGHSTPAKKEKSKKPIDPKENPEGFLQQVLKSPAALNKVNYHILKWVQETLEEDESKRKPLPSGKAGANSVEPKQFVQWLADGTVLAQLANKLVPGSVETVHEGEAASEKANQTANLQAFVDFKTKSGVAPQQTVTVEELQSPKWKSAYQKLFTTLYYLATQAQQTFGTVTGLDAQQIADEIAGISKVPIFQRVRHSVSSLLSELLNSTHVQSPAKGATAPENGTTNGEGAAEASTTNGTTTGEASAEPAQEAPVPSAEASAAVNGSK